MSLFGPGPTPGSAAPRPLFGSTTPGFGGSLFGSGAASGSSLFGTPTGPPAGGGMFGAAGAPATGASTGGLFGASTPGSLFGTPQTPAPFGGGFGQTTPPPQQQTPSLFGQSPGILQTPPSQQQQQQPPLLQQTPSLFGPSPGGGGGLFGQTPPQQQQTPSLFGQPQPAQAPPFGLQMPQQPSAFGSMQLTTQMAPVAPLAVNPPDREIQAIVDAYRNDPTNPHYRFRHLFLSVMEPASRARAPGIPEHMWAEAMNKLEAMDQADRERLWPEVVSGFDGLSRRLKLQDEALVSDADRLRMTQASVRQLQMHSDADTKPRIEHLRLQQQDLQRRLLRLVRVVEALEGKGLLSRLPLSSAEVQLSERLRNLFRKLYGSSADVPRRADAVLSTSRMKSATALSSTGGLLGPGQIDEKSLEDLQQVLRQQTEAFERLSLLLKKDSRDLEIITSDPTPSAPSGADARDGRSILMTPVLGTSLLGSQPLNLQQQQQQPQRALSGRFF